MILSILVVAAILILLLSSPLFLRYIGDRYIKPTGLKYSTINGSILNKIVLKDVRYKSMIRVKSLVLNYNILTLLSKEARVDNVLLDTPRINLTKIKQKSESDSFNLMPFLISKIKIKNLTLVKKRSYFIKYMTLLNLKFDKKLSIKKIHMLAKDRKYGSFRVEASLKSNILKGVINSSVVDFGKIKIKNLTTDFKYLLNADKIDFKANYEAEQDRFELKLKQKGYLKTDGKFSSKLFAIVTRTPIVLPAKTLDATLKGDADKIALHVELKSTIFDIAGDYKKFLIKGSSKDIELGKLGNFNIETNSTLKVAPFVLNTKILLQNKQIKAELNATKLDYNRGMEAKNVTIKLDSLRYGKVQIDGQIKSNELSADAKLYPPKKYLKTLKNFPYPISSKFTLNPKGLSLLFGEDKIRFKNLKNLELQDLELSLNYLFGAKKVDFRAKYRAKDENNLASVNQSGFFYFDGKYNSLADIKVIKSARELPFKKVAIKADGDLKKIALHVEAGLYKFDIDGNYKNFHIQGGAKGATFGFITNFPDMLKDEKTNITTDTNLNLYPLSLSGKFFAKSALGKLNGKYKIKEKSRLFEMLYKPNPTYKFYKNHKIEKISPAKITIYSDDDSKVLNIDAKMLNVTLFKKLNILGGWGNLAKLYFNINGDISKKNGISLNISAKLPSLRKFLVKTELIKPQDQAFVDGRVELSSKLQISKNIKFTSEIKMPWYEISVDKKSKYEGKNLRLFSSFKNNNIVISRYSFDFLKHHIYSNKPSKLKITKDKKIEFEEFWIFDNLRLQGVIDPLNHQGKLHLKGKNIHYKSKEADLSADAEISASLSSNGVQNVEGKVTLLGGVVKKVLKKEYASANEDIIVIQDIKENRKLKRNVSIQIVSKKPLRYKTKEIDLKFVPDFTIFQEAGGALEYLGMVTIPNGEIKKSGKVFSIAKSEVYLRGANPINPYLNINVFYRTLDGIKIKVYISNTLSSPLMILASQPLMSTNDIMSYILFGKPASTAFGGKNSGQKSISLGTVLYGTGIKQMFQKSTNIKIDTLNILSSRDKRLGYEIGASLNDKVRVVYRNDEISSIIIQYSLTKSIQIAVDVKESGEGVNILYSKDF